jgi:hypothetical protein
MTTANGQEMGKSKELARPRRQELTALTTHSTGKLSERDGALLTTLLRQMVPRYPHQDLSESMAGLLHDFEALAMKYGLRQVRDVLADLRIRPGQKFFPQPDQVAEECEAMAKNQRAEQERSLPAIGCDVCKGEIASGYVFKNMPDGWRGLVPCECRLARERAKKAMQVSA